MLSAKLDDPLLIAAARQLAPFYLRLGGSLADQVTYQEEDGCVPLRTQIPSRLQGVILNLSSHSPGDPAGDPGDPRDPRDPRGVASPAGARDEVVCSSCNEFVKDDGVRVGYRDGCLSTSRWDALSDFCLSAGCEIVFSINALRGRQRSVCPPRTDCRNVRLAPMRAAPTTILTIRTIRTVRTTLRTKRTKRTILTILTILIL